MSKRLIVRKTRPPSPVRAREEAASKHLTPAEMTTLRVFAELTEELGRSPSVREVSKAMGLSEQGAQRHLISLSFKGSLEDEKELITVGRKITALGKQWLKMPS